MLKTLPYKFQFSLLGATLALGAPAGWFILSKIIPDQLHQGYWYPYLFVGTITAFSAFGYFLGNSRDGLAKMLDSDHLTGLLNQRSFVRRLKEFYQLGIRHEDGFVIMMMDIDKFKKVNDEHNHLAGSKIICDVANIIHENLREYDLAARFGGDEFTVCLPRTSIDLGVRVAERIREKIRGNVFHYKNHRIRITTSIGVYGATAHKDLDIESILELADKELYRAKNTGRNRVCYGGEEESKISV